MPAHLGIRYATAARFEPPVPCDGEPTGRFGPACPQVPSPQLPVHDRYELPRQDEDCLHLNVWTPSTSGARPVLVWIHGGNFDRGSAADPLTWGDRLAERGDTVVVSVGHRLGVLGFLGPENLGMLDLVAALRWVQANIGAYGGDPGRVTIFGMSSGGMKVAALHAMPSAAGLFHRVVSQSGPGLRALEPEVAERFRAAYLDHLDGDPRTVPVDELLRAQVEVTGANPVDAGVQLGPVLGELLPVHPVDAPATVPWLIGTNRDELALMLAFDARYASYAGAESDADARERLARLTPEADRLLGTYREARPHASPNELLVGVLSDRMRLAAVAMAESKLGGPCWMYLFAHGHPELGAFHGLEVPYVFDCVDRSPMTGGGAEAASVASDMRDAWVAFARDGDPGWPAYDVADRTTMVFDVEPEVVADPGGAERRVLADLGLAWS